MRGQTARNDREIHDQQIDSLVMGVCQPATELRWEESSQSDANEQWVSVNEYLREIADKWCNIHIPFKQGIYW